MRVLALETKRTTVFLTLHEVFAIIWLVEILVRRSSEILGLVGVDTLSPIVLYVLLRTISSLVLVHVKHVRIHDTVHLRQVLQEALLLISNVERH